MMAASEEAGEAGAKASSSAGDDLAPMSPSRADDAQKKTVMENNDAPQNNGALAPPPPVVQQPQILSFGGTTGLRPSSQQGFRRGKWTPEEQDYAEQLIASFTAGTVAGCDEGITLRAFLARELRCDRMRISKKFAGASIGKLIFRRRAPPEPETERRIRELREAFHRSTFQGDAAYPPQPKSQQQQQSQQQQTQQQQQQQQQHGRHHQQHLQHHLQQHHHHHRHQGLPPPPLLGEVGGPSPSASSAGGVPSKEAASFVAASTPDGEKPPPVMNLLRCQAAARAAKERGYDSRRQQYWESQARRTGGSSSSSSSGMDRFEGSTSRMRTSDDHKGGENDFAFVVPQMGSWLTPPNNADQRQGNAQQLLAAATYNVEKAQRQHDAAQSALHHENRSYGQHPLGMPSFRQETSTAVGKSASIVEQCQALIQQQRRIGRDQQPDDPSSKEGVEWNTTEEFEGGGSGTSATANPHHHGIASLKRSWKDASELGLRADSDLTTQFPQTKNEPYFSDGSDDDEDDIQFNHSLNFLLADQP